MALSLNGGLAMPQRVGRRRPPRGRSNGVGDIQRLPGGNLPKAGGMPMPGMPPKSGMPMNGGTPAMPMKARGRGKGATNGQGVGLGKAMMPGIGAQLSRRVESGAIDMAQAKRVAGERQQFAKALGPDWRQRVFGAGGQRKLEGKAQSLLAANPDNAGLQGAEQRIRDRRASMLARAQAKIGAAPRKGRGRGRGAAASLLYGQQG